MTKQNTTARLAKTFTLGAFAATALTFAIGTSDAARAEASADRACVEKVMYGGINWGGGTEWYYENAVALCKGAKNHDARISCFTKQVGHGRNWKTAIVKCRNTGTEYTYKDSYEPKPARTHKLELVSYDHGKFAKRGDYWTEYDRYGYELDTYKETHRDDWNVYLYDINRDVHVEFDLYNQHIVYEGQPKYWIRGTDYAKPQPPVTHRPHKTHKVFTVKAGPIHNDRHAEKTCGALAYKYDAQWTGYWTTTVPGKMSVCELKKM